MVFTSLDIEELEKKYFEIIKTILINNKDTLKNRFNSKEAIRRDIENLSYKENDVEVGAERVLSSIYTVI